MCFTGGGEGERKKTRRERRSVRTVALRVEEWTRRKSEGSEEKKKEEARDLKRLVVRREEKEEREREKGQRCSVSCYGQVEYMTLGVYMCL